MSRLCAQEEPSLEAAKEELPAQSRQDETQQTAEALPPTCSSAMHEQVLLKSAAGA